MHLNGTVTAEGALVTADAGFAVIGQPGLAALAGRLHQKSHVSLPRLVESLHRYRGRLAAADAERSHALVEIVLVERV